MPQAKAHEGIACVPDAGWLVLGTGDTLASPISPPAISIVLVKAAARI